MPYPSDVSHGAIHETVIVGDIVYFSTVIMGQDQSQKDMWLTAADVDTGVVRWQSAQPLHFDDLTAYPVPVMDIGADSILVDSAPGYVDGTVYLIDIGTGKSTQLESQDGISYQMVAGVVVRTADFGAEIAVVDATGEPVWTLANEVDIRDDIVVAVTSEADFGDGHWDGSPVSAQYFMTVDADNGVTVYDKATGAVSSRHESLLPPEWTLDRPVVYEDVMYVRGSSNSAQEIKAFELSETFDEVGGWELADGEALYGMELCAVNRVCASGYSLTDSQSPKDVVLGTDGEGIVWRTPKDAPLVSSAKLSFAGDSLAVSYTNTGGADAQTFVYGPDLAEPIAAVDGEFTAVDGAFA
ncbi:MAG: PQQ-binding-like beta-propeller repeat protein, partial [Stackebrandtia sp.]